ncbi:hypothetical protein PR202_gb08054 [Eleusine coracana subsp. coracana]|uniref:Uncharacterized protein n=1 Tax=Eleusine coracana subsp. coracana TaxID=191504 RepID=A0AAV5EB97_ELECO|nr:hypothetical protein PR202_gb08054 [Eleusine coracana subsp. coracana]
MRPPALTVADGSGDSGEDWGRRLGADTCEAEFWARERSDGWIPEDKQPQEILEPAIVKDHQLVQQQKLYAATPLLNH